MSTPTKVNARGFTFEVAATAATPSFTEIGGINTFTFSRSSQSTDTTDFDSDGVAESEAMERSKTLGVTGFFKEDASKNRDAGQTLVETAAGATGPASIYTWRLTTPAGKKYTFDGWVELGDVGGGNNDKASWGCTITRSGPTVES